MNCLLLPSASHLIKAYFKNPINHPSRILPNKHPSLYTHLYSHLKPFNLHDYHSVLHNNTLKININLKKNLHYLILLIFIIL